MRVPCAALLCLLMPASAAAASPEDRYLAARDGWIAKLKSADEADDAALAREKGARRELEKRLRKVLGPVAIKGMSGHGTLNLDTLFAGDLGFGMLDGLRFAGADGKLEVVVTNRILLRKWLAALPADDDVPPDIEKALAAPGFYTFATSPDAAASLYGTVPLPDRAGAVGAVAMLAAHSQDSAPAAPDELIVTASVGERVFIATADIGKQPAVPACEKLWTETLARAEAANVKYQASGLKDEAAFDDGIRQREDGERAMLACYGEQLAGQAFLLALQKRAAAIVGALPKR